MNNVRFARQQFALGFLSVGAGLVLLYAPALLGFLVGRWAPLFWILLLPVSLYVIGSGIARVIEGGVRIVHAVKDEKYRGN